MEFKHLLVTGGAGFIGSNFVRMALRDDDQLVVTNLNLLTYSGNRESLTDVEATHGSAGDGRHRLVVGDIGDEALVAGLLGAPRGAGGPPRVDGVVHFAAESHVDQSILGPMPFVETNVKGTTVLLECCRRSLDESPRNFRFLHVSTDEVYGSLGDSDPAFTERTPIAPNSPYSASKAGSDLLVRAYFETFGFPALITRCSNNYGPYQFPEKLIPLIITRALGNEPLPVYGDGTNVRDWIHVHDHCDGVRTVLERGTPGECYNLGGEAETTNIDIVHRVLAALDRPRSLITHVTDRLGHDRRYAMDITLAREALGWTPSVSLADGLEATVKWYVDNRDWWGPLLQESGTVAKKLYQS